MKLTKPGFRSNSVPYPGVSPGFAAYAHGVSRRTASLFSPRFYCMQAYAPPPNAVLFEITETPPADIAGRWRLVFHDATDSTPLLLTFSSSPKPADSLDATFAADRSADPRPLFRDALRATRLRPFGIELGEPRPFTLAVQYLGDGFDWEQLYAPSGLPFRPGSEGPWAVFALGMPGDGIDAWLGIDRRDHHAALVLPTDDNVAMALVGRLLAIWGRPQE